MVKEGYDYSPPPQDLIVQNSIDGEQEHIGIEQRTELLRTVQPYFIDFGVHPLVEYIDRIERRALVNPDIPNINLVIGPPGQGKSVVEEQMYTYILQRPHGLLNNQAERIHKKRVQRVSYQWGDVFPLLPNKWRMGENPYESDESYDKKLTEVASAETSYFYRLRNFIETINENSAAGRNDAIWLIGADIAGILGHYTDDGDQIGMPRGNRYLYDLVHHEGLFAGIEYNLSALGLIASPEVQKKAKEDRSVQLLYDAPEDRIAALEQRGVHFVADAQQAKGTDVKAAIQFLGEGAPSKEMDFLEEDLNRVMEYLVANGDIASDLLQPSSLTPERIRKLGQVRTELMGKTLRHFLEKVYGFDKNSDNVTIFRNDKVMSKVYLDQTVTNATLYPLREEQYEDGEDEVDLFVRSL